LLAFFKDASMTWRICTLIYLLLISSLAVHAQMGMQKPRPVTLRFIVTIDGNAEKARRATIELFDDLGSGSGRAITNENGEASFQTLTGVYRIRVTGPGIRAYEGEVDIAPVETTHLERVVVRRDSTADSGNPGAPIAAIRLNIPDNAHKTFDKATQALHKEKWEESRGLFQKAIAEYADYDMAYNGLGIVELQLKNNDAAQQAFLKAIQLNSKYAEAQRNLARLFIQQRNNDDAIVQLQASLSTEPNDVWALGNLAYLELQARKFEDALVNAQKVHTLPHPNMPFAHMVAAYAAEELGKDDVAEKELHLYLDEDPKGPNVGRAQQELSRFAKPAPK
jgi:tetratricopeptide (TPR) repeat protein